MASDHYAVLNLKHDASFEEIQHAYRALALQYHPDRNRAPDAAARMAAINEAYEVLSDRMRRRDYDSRISAAAPHAELASSILAAARDVVLRAGWTVVQDLGRVMLLENRKHRARVIFTDHLNNDMLLGISRQYPEPTAILTVSIEGPIHVSPQHVVMDLVRGQRYGLSLNEGADAPLRSLLTGFL
jgi:hypothetical protein